MDENELEELIKRRDKLEKEYAGLDDVINGADYYIDDGDTTSSQEYKLQKIESDIEKVNFRIGEIYYKRKNTIYAKEYNEKMGNYLSGSLISDHKAEQDLFNRKEKAEMWAHSIASVKTTPPYNFGVFAHWGEGKTTFLQYIQDELVEINKKIKNGNEKQYTKTYIINYDASEYEDKDKIWASMLHSMFIRYEETMWFPQIFYNIKKVCKNRRKFISNLISYSISFIIVLLLSFYTIYNLSEDWDNEYKILIKSTSALVALLILITKLLIPIIKGLLQSAVPLSKKIINDISLPNYIDKLGERENIKNDLLILVDAWISRYKRKEERLVLFVDELDRCTDKGIVELFQAMQLFLKIPNLIIVFAIDQEYLKRSLIKSYDLQPEDINTFLNEYLEKYINMPISLETDINYSEFIEYLLNKESTNSELFTLSVGEKQKLKEAINTIPISRLTPRKTIKIVNIIMFSKEICVLVNKNSESSELIDFRDYILWFVFSYFYRDASKLLYHYCKQFGNYYKIGEVLLRMSRENKSKISEVVNNPRIIQATDSIITKDISKFESILSGFNSYF